MEKTERGTLSSFIMELELGHPWTNENVSVRSPSAAHQIEPEERRLATASAQMENIRNPVPTWCSAANGAFLVCRLGAAFSLADVRNLVKLHEKEERWPGLRGGKGWEGGWLY